MTSTASSRLRLDKQATGDNPDAWGERLNGVIDLVDEAFGFAEIAVNGNVVLSAANFVSDQARRGVLRFTGAGGFSVTIPSVEKLYLIDNRCTSTVTIKTASTPGAQLASGDFRPVYCDGATVNAPSPTGQTALGTPFTPAGAIAATNVQSALQELDAEKVAKADYALLASFSGYVKLHNGLIIQWGRAFNSASDYIVNFPLAFPSVCASVIGNGYGGVAANVATVVHVDVSGAGNFAIRTRVVTNGGTVAALGSVDVRWIAVGY